MTKATTATQPASRGVVVGSDSAAAAVAAEKPEAHSKTALGSARNGERAVRVSIFIGDRTPASHISSHGRPPAGDEWVFGRMA